MTRPSTVSVPQALPQASAGLRLALFGATGGVGRSLVKLALAAGHQVTALVRDPARLELAHPRLTLVSGEGSDAAAVAKVVAGADAVLVALGAPALSRSRIRSEGTKLIVDAMQAAGVERIVCVSLLGVADSRTTLPLWIRYGLFPLYLRRAIADHERQEEVLRASDLAWTSVRPPFLTDGAHTGRYAHGFATTDGLKLEVSRADVADFMLAQLGSSTYLRRAAAISYARAA